MSDVKPVIISTRNQSDPVLKMQITPDFSGIENSYLAYRKSAWNSFNKLPFPSSTDEAWKRTSIRGLPLEQIKPVESLNDQTIQIPDALTKPLADDLHGGQILLTNSAAKINLDPSLAKQGVVFTDLLHGQTEHAAILDKVLQNAKTCQEKKFAALSAAFGKNGILLYVPKGVKVEKPLHSLVWTSGAGLLNAFQVFIWLEEDSSATYVHENASPESALTGNVHAGVMEIHVGEGAKLNFVELQSYGSSEWNFTHEKVNVERDAEVDWIFGSLGSHLTKNFSDLNLIGQGSTGKMSGFYFTNGNQHLDHDTQQNHLAPNTTSDLLFKGALLGESRSVWQGMIYVAKNATKTDGYQANRNLVLSEKARADSIPGLEILTDDVRCTHGATVGKIDADQLFYLESRGIPHKEAEKLIVEGFFDPIMQRIPFEGVRSRFQAAIEEKMSEY